MLSISCGRYLDHGAVVQSAKSERPSLGLGLDWTSFGPLKREEVIQ